jgi:hypothetical protein
MRTGERLRYELFLQNERLRIHCLGVTTRLTFLDVVVPAESETRQDYMNVRQRNP